MSLDRFDFDSISEADLLELVAARVPEGVRLDLKRDNYGNSDADRREFLKDVSALANSHGGHLVIGVDEEEGAASAVVGVVGINPDDAVLRMEQLAAAGIQPRIQGLRMKAVRLGSGAHCFVVRVPKSWHPPHRVSAQNSNRFWVRNSGGCHEASIEELRSLFNQGSDAALHMRQFRSERLVHLNSGDGARPLHGEGRVILHIVPLIAALDTSFIVDLARARRMDAAFRPIDSMGYSPRINLDGFVNERGGEVNLGYTQLFRNGTVEATKARLVRQAPGRFFIPGLAFERGLFEVLPQYINGLRDLGVPAPLAILITLDQVAGAAYVVARDPLEPEPPIERSTVFLPECTVDAYGPDADYQRAVRPAIDALWNASGYATARSFDAEGRWVEQR